MDVIMPQLGETVAEGTVTKWYKAVGDAVKADETLFDVETDKVNSEIPAPVSGVVAEILVQEGVTAKVGTRLAVIREDDGGEGRREKGEGESEQREGGRGKGEGEREQREGRRGKGEGEREQGEGRREKGEGESPPASRLTPHASQRLSPVVRRLIAEHELNPSDLQGTGRDGRITREDVLKFIDAAGQRAAPAEPQAGATRKRMTSVRKRTAEHMLKSWTTAPHVLQAVEVDFHKVEQARASVAASWKSREHFSLTYLPFVVRAVSVALSKYPLLNASLDGEDLVLHPRVNIGIAIDLNFEGLVVPVLKDVAARSLPQIARDIHDLADRARANKLKPDDMTQGTYTISNNGAFGTLFTAPIINQPQVAILSTDAVRKKPVVIESAEGDSIAIRPIGMLAQTFDHRAVDGAYSAAFLREVKTILETSAWVQALNL